MFSRNNHRKKTSSRRSRVNGRTSRRFFVEPLERRLMLAGNVDVEFNDDTGVLSFEGDDSDNNILIMAGENPGEITVRGASYDKDAEEFTTDTDINDAVSVITYDNVQEIEVNLEGGSDKFVIVGDDGSLILITADIDIDNEGGRNFNEFINARIVGEVSIERTEGDAGNNVTIDGTEIVGTVEIDNFNADEDDEGEGFDGDSVTMIINGSRLHDDIEVDNGEGKDIFVVDASSIDGDVDLENGEGETRTFFGETGNTRPVVGGDIDIENDEDNDEFLLNKTDVWGAVDIDNGDGRTTTTVTDSKVGLNPTTDDPTFSLENGFGFDTFIMIGSDIRDGLEIDNDADADNESLSGSETAIMSSVIGGDFELLTDNGFDMVNIMASEDGDDDEDANGVLFKGDVDIELFDGGSLGSIFDTVIRGDFSLDTDDGADEFTFERTTVEDDVEIEMGEGRDRLELLKGTSFEGATSLFGDEDELDEDEDVDTLIQEVGENAIDIAFLLANTFNVNEFVDGE